MAVRTDQLQPANRDSAQPKTDAELMIGGPGQEGTEAAPPPEPTGREITIGGRKFSVDSDLAQSLEQRERDFDRKLNEHDRELGELRKLKQSYTAPAAPTEQPKGYSTLLFEDPEAAVKRIKDEIVGQVTSLYTQDKSQSKFWDDFYRHSKDLDRSEDDFMVRAVLQEHFDELAPLKPSQAIEQLADLTRRQILRFSQKAKLQDENDNSEPASRTRVEGASRSAPRTAPERVSEGPSSISDVIRQRRAARMNGRRPPVAES